MNAYRSPYLESGISSKTVMGQPKKRKQFIPTLPGQKDRERLQHKGVKIRFCGITGCYKMQDGQHRHRTIRADWSASIGQNRPPKISDDF